MKKTVRAAALVAIAGLVEISLANATPLISIGLAINGSPITTVASGSGGTAYVNSFGSFDFNGIAAVGSPPLPSGSLLDTASLNLTSSATSNELSVYITEQNITEFPGLSAFASGFTTNLLTPGWSVTESSYLDGANGQYALTTPLGSATFAHTGSTVVGSPVVDAGAGPYSITTLYVIDPKGFAGADNSTINVTVPEPATFALFGAGLLACAAFVGRRRRSEQFRAA